MRTKGLGSRTFDALNGVFLGLLALMTVFPFWSVIVASVISLKEYGSTGLHLFPKQLDFSAYRFIFRLQELWRSYGVTLFVTVVGTCVNMVLTIAGGYVLSKDLKGGRVIMFLVVFTMLFDGGMIPRYMVVRSVGIMNTVWALILPGAILTYNLIIMRNFYYTLPASLEESAKLDGCNDVGILIRIVAPLSLPAIAAISLFYAVFHWNDFLSAVLYLSTRLKWPLQLFLRAMLFENAAENTSGGDDPYLFGQPIKMAAIMVGAIPIMCVYPFFQKFFTRGILLGAVKG